MSDTATVTVADILELRADGLTEEEIWSLLCQAVQTLQDLFLSEKITKREKMVPLVSPHTLGISRKGTAVISFVGRIHARHAPYLAPEYADRRRCLNNLDWEKMWVYSLGRTLLFALKTRARKESLMVLKFMTAKDPSLRASLMALLIIISQHCKLNLPTKPSSHLVKEMYKEVFGSPIQCLLPLDIPDADNATTEKTSRTGTREAPLHFSDSSGKTLSRCNSAEGCSKASSSSKRNPVQRAPSRLYGLSTKPGSGRNRAAPGACVGPEFVVRGREAAKVVHVGEAKASRRKALTVILLTGQKVRMTCDPHRTTSGKLFEALVQVENIEDNYLFGLAATINGDFVFVPSETKVHRVAPPGWKDGGKEPNSSTFFLYVRVKFFLPNLWGLRNPNTKHLMYLQLRRSLLEQQIRCEPEESFVLGGLALQAEFGDFDETVHGASSYFLLEHYLPEELVDEKLEPEALLQEHHKSRRGLDRSLAEDIFVAEVQRLPEYGSHHFTALWFRKSVGIPMWVTVNPQGLYLYEKKKNVLDRKMHGAFPWKSIQGFSCNENWFRLIPHDVFGQKGTCYKLHMDNKKIELNPLHALSQEFGVRCKSDNKSAFHPEKKWSVTEQWDPGVDCQKNGQATSAPRHNFEERQNKENQNPLQCKREKRTGVKMGVSAFQASRKERKDGCGKRFSFSETSGESLDAYVIDSSIGSSDEKFTYDLHESMPSKLADKWDDVSWEEERILRKVHLTKDKYESFGLEIVEGSNGGLFVESVLRRRGNIEMESIQKGDQLMSVNGICLLNLNYGEALNVLKSMGSEIEILLSQRFKREVRQKPLEDEYLKNIRYETANEPETVESECALKKRQIEREDNCEEK